MTGAKSPEITDSTTKIHELFRDRLLTVFAKGVLGDEEYLHWLSSATSIQDAIYRIDAYYESSRHVCLAIEKPYWDLVESRILDSNGSAAFSVWKSFSELRRYGQLERRIHEFDIIDPREFSQIVRLKASDVRIARALIWSYGTALPRCVLDFWSRFDECGEIIEDLVDVTEDGRDWNFNFWLYSYMAGGDASQSILAASQTLREKLSDLESAYRRLPNGEREGFRHVLHRVLRSGKRTLKQGGIVLDLVERGVVLRYGEGQGEQNATA